jgi:hypothetical protein
VPLDWLEAKDIIIVDRYPTTQDSKPKSTRRGIKKEREDTTATSIARPPKPDPSVTRRGQSGGHPNEVIDVDALDSDNDSDVVVLNDPVESKVTTLKQTLLYLCNIRIRYSQARSRLNREIRTSSQRCFREHRFPPDGLAYNGIQLAYTNSPIFFCNCLPRS